MLSEILISITSVRKPYLLARSSVSYFNWFLEHGISLSTVQLFVISIEGIFQRDVGNTTRTS